MVKYEPSKKVDKHKQVYICALFLFESAHTTPVSLWMKLFITAQDYFSLLYIAGIHRQTLNFLFTLIGAPAAMMMCHNRSAAACFWDFHHSGATGSNCYEIISAIHATNKLWNSTTQCKNYHMTELTYVLLMSIHLFVLKIPRMMRNYYILNSWFGWQLMSYQNIACLINICDSWPS